jgi:hypothetical protein
MCIAGIAAAASAAASNIHLVYGNVHVSEWGSNVGGGFEAEYRRTAPKQ